MTRQINQFDRKAKENSMFLVTADYCKRENHPQYLVFAKTKKEAKRYFESVCCWLRVYSVERLGEEELRNRGYTAD